MNVIRTAALLAFLTALFMGVGYLLGGSGGMMIAFIAACGMNFFSWWNSDKMVLRMQGAEEVSRDTYPDYYDLVADLAERADMPMPKVYVMHTDQPNAFATGRSPDNAAVAASSGLLDMLEENEVAGVIAHELAHIKNRDTLTMTISASIAGAISMLGNFAFFFGGRREGGSGFLGVIVAMVVAPFAASVVQMAISRTREYAADRLGALICGEPMALASALNKISNGVALHRMETAERNHATAHMFIINPLLNKSGDSLFSTHPSTENRIAALRQLDEEMRQARLEQGEQWGRSEGDNEFDRADPRSEIENNSDWGARGNAGAKKASSKKSNPWGERSSNDADTGIDIGAKDSWGERKARPSSVPKTRAKKTLKNPVWGKRSKKIEDAAPEVAKEKAKEKASPKSTKKQAGASKKTGVSGKAKASVRKTDNDDNPWN